MVELSLPPPPDVDFAQPARRWLPDASTIAAGCESAIAAGEPSGLVDLLAELGAPVLDSTVTPLSARASLLGAADGRAFYHHELRLRMPMPPGLEPETDVWDGGTTPAWREGVLEEPKYFSFFQDAPFPAYNPNYRRKWRPHELIHGRLGFFWHPEMTRFEFYVGARLNELLPVVHWYGFDEIFRPRCDVHRGEVLYQEYCAACEGRAEHYWRVDAEEIEARREEAERWAARALAHFEVEWEACNAEIATGRRHPTPGLQLDASSDSVGYLRGHWNRVTDWSFGAWLETFLQDGVDYHSSLHAYRDHLAATTQSLLSGTIAVDPEVFRARRGRRAIQDAAYQIYLAMGWLAEGSAELARVEARLLPHLEQAAHHVHHLRDAEQLADFSVDVLFELLEACEAAAADFPPDVAAALPALGYTWERPAFFIERASDLLQEGIESSLPGTAASLADRGAACFEFAAAADFSSVGRFADRFARWSQPGNVGLEAAQLADFEAWSMSLPRRDEEAELFGALPAGLDEFVARPARLRAHRTLRRGTFATRAAARVMAAESLPPRDTVNLARIFARGELRVVVDDEATSLILDAVAQGSPIRAWVEGCDLEVLSSLLDHGFIVWLPDPA